MAALSDVRASLPAPGLLYLRRGDKQEDRYLLVNTPAHPLEADFTLAHAPGARAVVINPETDERTAVGNADVIHLSFAEKQPLLVVFSRQSAN